MKAVRETFLAKMLRVEQKRGDFRFAAIGTQMSFDSTRLERKIIFVPISWRCTEYRIGATQDRKESRAKGVNIKLILILDRKY